jgi:hypothetical protein
MVVLLLVVFPLGLPSGLGRAAGEAVRRRFRFQSGRGLLDAAADRVQVTPCDKFVDQTVATGRRDISFGESEAPQVLLIAGGADEHADARSGDSAGPAGIGFEYDRQMRSQQRLRANVTAVIRGRPGRHQKRVEARRAVRGKLRHLQTERPEDPLPAWQRLGGRVQGIKVAAHRRQRSAEVLPAGSR